MYLLEGKGLSDCICHIFEKSGKQKEKKKREYYDSKKYFKLAVPL